MGGEQTGNYAQLPDELIEAIIQDVPATVRHARQYITFDHSELDRGRRELDEQGLIKQVSEGDSTDSIIAVDGGYAIERLADVDIALVQAAGVEGLRDNVAHEDWGQKKQQYTAWQRALSHNFANDTLVRGIMSLMEMIVLSGSDHEIKLLDGSHITQVIAMDKLFGANQELADAAFVEALQDFIDFHFDGDIYRISQVLSNVVSNDSIVASTKYSSSRAALDTYLSHIPIVINDKAFFGRILKAGEYLTPQPVHASGQDSTSWSNARIAYDIPLVGVDRDKFNWLMNEAIGPLRTKGMHGEPKSSNLHYTYFKPYDEGPAYRLEIKRSLATDNNRLQKVFRSIRQQVVYPDIIEPYPQYLADIVAKSVSKGLQAVKEAVVLSTDKSKDASESLLILRGYRT